MSFFVKRGGVKSPNYTEHIRPSICFQTIDSKGVFNLSTFNYTFCLHKTEIVLLISLGPAVLYINSLLS